MICVLCGREGYTTGHHLVPRSTHTRKSVKRKFDRDERDEKVEMCVDCHTQIHRLITEKELAKSYFTVSALKHHPDVARYLKWVKGRPMNVASKANRFSGGPRRNEHHSY